MVSRSAYEYRGVAGAVGSVLERLATRSRLVIRTVGGHPYRFNADCFFQANILSPSC